MSEPKQPEQPEQTPEIPVEPPAVESPPAPLTIVVEEQGRQIIAEPVKVTPEQQEPAKPAGKAMAGICPICNEGPFPRLDVHIRFKHEQPNKGGKRIKGAKLNGDRTQEPIPPPDFSDIDDQRPKPEPATPNVVTPDERYAAMANMSFDMATGLLAQIFGPEWMPRADHDNPNKSTERETIVLATKKYFESMSMPDIPPGYVLCFVCIAYAAPRFSAPPTRNKMAMGWLWLKSKFTRKAKLGVVTVVK